jgi:hypothetical protein
MDLSIYDMTRIERWNKILSMVTKPSTPGVIASITELSPDTTRLDCIKMCKQGFMGLEEVKMPTGWRKDYFPKMTQVNMEMYQPMEARDPDSYKKKPQALSLANGATLHRLTDTVHHTRTAPKRRDAWIGSTFSTMSY